MVAIALKARGADCASPAQCEWPADDDPLRIPQGPICLALVYAVLSTGDGAGPWGERPRSAARPARARVVLVDGAGESGAAGFPCPLTLDVLLVVLDLLQRNGGVAPVSPRIVLARKGYRRWGRERQSFERKVLDQIRLLQRLSLGADGLGGPLLQFSARNVARTDFLVRAAPALAAELERRVCIELPNAVLRLDHRRNRGSDVLAKKLAVVVAARGPSDAVRARDLLKQTGHPACPGAGRRNHVAERLPDALRRLRSLEVFDVQGLDPLEHAKASRRNWLSASVWVRLKGRGEDPLATELRGPGSSDPDASGADARPSGHSAAARRGRPRFQPSSEQRSAVSMLRAAGATRERIAQEVGVSLPTLRAYFATELRDAEIQAEPPSWVDVAIKRRATSAIPAHAPSPLGETRDGD